MLTLVAKLRLCRSRHTPTQMAPHPIPPEINHCGTPWESEQTLPTLSTGSETGGWEHVQSKDRRGTDGGTQTGTQELGNRGAPAQVTALRGWRQLCLPRTVLPPVCGFGCHISLDSPKSCSCIGPQGTHCCQVLPEARRGGLQQATGPGRKGGGAFSHSSQAFSGIFVFETALAAPSHGGCDTESSSLRNFLGL